jgi:hypothetical protein
MVIGNFILLNLFVAILLNGFSNHKSLQSPDQVQDESTLLKKAVESELEKEEERHLLEFRQERQLIKEPNKRPLPPSGKANSQQENGGRAAVAVREEEFAEKGSVEGGRSQSFSNEDFKDAFFRVGSPSENRADVQYCEESLFIFGQQNRLRVWCGAVADSKWFERATFAVILLSSLKLIFDTFDRSEWTNRWFELLCHLLDIFFNAFFITETSMKVIQRGMVVHPHSYLREAWAVLDMLIVVSSIVEMSVTASSVDFLKTLRVLRTFRTLRFISHNRNLKLVVVSLLESISGIVNVSAVIMLFWIMYGILGINLMSGRMGFCQFPDPRNYYYINATMCPELGGEWADQIWNFDNIFNAIVTLFGLTSMASWEDFMFSAADANDASVGPVLNASYWISVYYMVFCLVSGMFLSNLFIGIIFYEFTTVQNRKKQTFFKTITEEQNRWLMMQKLIKQAEPNFYLIYRPKAGAPPDPVRPVPLQLGRDPHHGRHPL